MPGGKPCPPGCTCLNHRGRTMGDRPLTNKERRIRLWNERRIAGLCLQCGKHYSEETTARCKKCLEKSKVVKRTRKTKGLCPTCGTKSPPLGRATCERCSVQNKNRYFTLKAKGLCVQCCAPAASNSTLCIKCKKKQRGRMRLSKYKITPKKYKTKLKQQNNKCAICGEAETQLDSDGKTKSLGIDHNHACCPGEKSCGQCLRGLLCGDCNRALGLFKDSYTSCVAAAKYLEEHANTKK